MSLRQGITLACLHYNFTYFAMSIASMTFSLRADPARWADYYHAGRSHRR